MLQILHVHKNAIIIFPIALLLVFSFVSVIPPQNSRAASQSDGKPQSGQQVAQYDIDKGCAKNTALIPNMKQFLTYFNCGHVTHFDNGTTLRKFSLIIEETHKIPITLPEDTKQSVMFPSWSFNASIPGPTMRMTKGDHIEVTVYNRGTMAHTLHMHSIHAGSVDGVPIVSGESGFIAPGKSFTYKFIADPIGIFPYHCHMTPVALHINMGLYGGMIIDPPANQARPVAKEIVMYLSGFDLSFKKPYPSLINVTQANALMNGEDNNMTESIADEHDNSIYGVNGMANYYMHHPINVTLHEPLRIYVFNMLDFEPNFFHLHGQLFQYYPSGTSKNPAFTNDVVELSQGDRGILETQFDLPGVYMAHAHEEQIGGRGWSSLFSVK